MAGTDAMLGGEGSGGFAFRGHIPERDGILSGISFADMIVKYGQPLSRIMNHLTELVGPHFYARHDLHLEREEYAARRSELYSRLEKEPPARFAVAGSCGPVPADGSSTTWRVAAGWWVGLGGPRRWIGS